MLFVDKSEELKQKLLQSRGICHKVSKRVSKILKECPNLGQTVEEFVKAGNVGADQWRRTEVLPFDGNTDLSMKVIYG